MAEREEFIQVLGQQIKEATDDPGEQKMLDRQMEIYDGVVQSLDDDELVDVANANRHLTETYEDLADTHSGVVIESALNLRKMHTQLIAAELHDRDIENKKLSGDGWEVVDARLD